MGLIAISVLFLFYALSFTQTLKGDHCMHFNNVMLLWGQPKRHIHGEVAQRPTLKRHNANSPTEVTLLLQPANICLFLKPLYVCQAQE